MKKVGGNLLMSDNYNMRERARVVKRMINVKLCFIFFFLILLININFISASQKYILKVTEEHPFFVMVSSSADENSKFVNIDSDLDEVMQIGNDETSVRTSVRTSGKTNESENNKLNGIWKIASELNVGDFLLTADGKKAKIINIKEVNSDVEVYNLQVDNVNTYYANNALVHNKAVKYGCPEEENLLAEVFGEDIQVIRNLITGRFVVVKGTKYYEVIGYDFKNKRVRAFFPPSIGYYDEKGILVVISQPGRSSKNVIKTYRVKTEKLIKEKISVDCGKPSLPICNSCNGKKVFFNLIRHFTYKKGEDYFADSEVIYVSMEEIRLVNENGALNIINKDGGYLYFDIKSNILKWKYPNKEVYITYRGEYVEFSDDMELLIREASTGRLIMTIDFDTAGFSAGVAQ